MEPREPVPNLWVEWIEDETDVPGWFVCDTHGPREGSYALRSEAEEALRADRGTSDDPPSDPLAELYESTRAIPGRDGWRIDEQGREWYSAAWLGCLRG